MFKVLESNKLPDVESDIYLSVLQNYGHDKALIDGYESGIENFLYMLKTKVFVLGIRNGEEVTLRHKPRLLPPKIGVFQILEQGFGSYSMTVISDCKIKEGNKEITLENVNLGELPIMHKSDYDTISKDPEEMLKQGRDIRGPGGIFTVSGRNRVFNLQETLNLGDNICYFKDLKNDPNSLVSSITTESRFGMTAMYSIGLGGNSILRYDNFRGFSNGPRKDSMDVLDTFTFLRYNENKQPLADYIVKFTRPEWQDKIRMALSPSIAAYYNHLNNLKDPSVEPHNKEIIVVIKRIRNENYSHITPTYYENIIKADLYSHVGVTPEGIEVKMATLARQIVRLLETHLGLRSHDDRNSYVNKRIKSPGIALLHLLNLSMDAMHSEFYKNYSITHPIDKLKALLEARPLQVDIEPSFEKSWGLKGTPGLKNANFVEIHKNEQFVLQHTQIDKSAKGRDAHSKDYNIRANQPSQAPQIDLSETPENSNTGLVGYKSSGCYFSHHQDMNNIIAVINTATDDEDRFLFKWNEFDRSNHSYYDTIVTINGMLHGLCNGIISRDILRRMRRVGAIPRDVELVYLEEDKLLHIKCDGGRPIIAYFTVDHTPEGLPYLTLEKDGFTINEIKDNRSVFGEWLKKGHLDLVGPKEMDKEYACIALKEMRSLSEQLTSAINNMKVLDDILVIEPLEVLYVSLDDEYKLVSRPERDTQVTIRLEEHNRYASYEMENLSNIENTIIELSKYENNPSYSDNLEYLRGERDRTIERISKYIGRIEAQIAEYENKKPVTISDILHMKNRLSKEIEELRHKNSFTYCLPDPMMMVGFTSSLLYLHNHNPAPRQTFACKMIKQSRTLPSHTQRWRPIPCKYGVFPTRGPVETITYEYYGLHTHPVGISSIISFTIGQELVEDMMKVSRGWVTRGAGHSVTSKEIHKKIPRVGLVDSKGGATTTMYVTNKMPAAIIKNKPARVFENLGEDGLVKPGSVLREGDCVIGAYIEIVYADNKETQYSDRSKYIKRSKRGVVKDVVDTNNINGERLIKIHINEYKVPEKGDKYSNAHAQKCTIGEIEEDYNMTISMVDGSQSDIDVNVHSLPSRMTVGFIIELVMGKAAVLSGQRFDGTPYHDRITWEELDQILESNGYTSKKEMRYNRRTGKVLESYVFSGVAHQYGLVHEPKPKLQYRYIGKNDAATHQSITGPDNNGGQRMGEMECDVIETHGASDILVQWTTRNADYAVFFTCNICNTRIYPQKVDKVTTFYCRTCQTFVADVKYAVSHVGQDIMHKYSTLMGCNYKYILQPKKSPYLTPLSDY